MRFVDDYAVDEVERNDRCFAFFVGFDGRTVRRLLLVPTTIRDYQACVAKGGERTEIIARMEALCADLGTTAFREIDAGLEILPPARAGLMLPPP